MGKKVFEAIAAIGEYQNQYGETKKRYHKCGVVFETERGLSLKLESIPVGNEWNGWMFFAEPRPSDQAGQSRENPPRGGGGSYNAPAPAEQAAQDEFDDDIPFITRGGSW